MTSLKQIVCAALLCALPTFAGTALGEQNDAAISPGQRAKQESRDNRQQALLHKGLGDGYAAQGDFHMASEEFLLALSSDRSAFTEEDQVRMAVVLSRDERHADALAVLEPIVRRNLKNFDARIQYARVLSWTGKLAEAEAEADAVLAEIPDSAEAMVVKANILRWNGEPRLAGYFYRKALAKREDFDARLGLAYTELEDGSKIKAEESAGLLKPDNASQALEQDRLNKAIRESNPPSRAASLTRYKDSDGNRVDAYGLSSGFLFAGARMDLAYRQVHAQVHTVNLNGPDSASAEEASFKMYMKQGLTGAGGGVGIAHAGQGQAPYIVTGHVRADTGVQGWLVGAALSKEALTDTALLINNRIFQASEEVFASREFLARYGVSGSFRHAEYSDGNHSQDWNIRLNYTLSPDRPGIVIGYRLRYLEFGRQSGGGYFDPNRLLSNEVRAEVTARAGRFHGSFVPVLGYQEFDRFGSGNHEFVYSVRGAVGFKLRNNLSADFSIEGGKNVAGAVSVYRYSIAELRLTRVF